MVESSCRNKVTDAEALPESTGHSNEWVRQTISVKVLPLAPEYKRNKDAVNAYINQDVSKICDLRVLLV